jgi:hypothetical protein
MFNVFVTATNTSFITILGNGKTYLLGAIPVYYQSSNPAIEQELSCRPRLMKNDLLTYKPFIFNAY